MVNLSGLSGVLLVHKNRFGPEILNAEDEEWDEWQRLLGIYALMINTG